MEGLKRTDRKLVYSGTILNVYDDTMEDGQGNQMHWDIVAHRLGGACVLPVMEDGSLLLVRQYRPAVELDSLEIPAGARDSENEAFIDCAARELEEETGYRPGRIEPLVCIVTTPAFCDEELQIFLAEDLQPGAQNPDPAEFLTVERHSLEDCLQMIFDQTIRDSKTVAAILAYACKKNKTV